MSNRADEIRKRIARRKKEKSLSPSQPNRSQSVILPSDEEKYGMERFPSYEMGPSSDNGHPLFNKEVIMLKVLGAGILVLLTAILFNSQAPMFDKTKTVITQTMEKEFQFAAINTWYEEKFGKPLALLPMKTDAGEGDTQKVFQPEYAVPASSKVVQNFKADGQGIMIQTGAGEKVDAMNGGTVIFAGKKEELGNTVVIQHSDKSETWYGHLDTIEVTQYQSVSAGSKVGTVSLTQDKNYGEFYFAIKKGDAFIDPIQVITFE